MFEIYKNSAWVEPFLMMSVGLFIVASIVLYLMIIRSRSTKIKQEQLRADYTIVIERLMFSMIFEDIPSAVITEDKEYKMLSNDSFFKELLMESILNLHKNYEGTYAQKLEQFYKESGLIKDSFLKLRSRKWEIKCLAITELAEMNSTRAFESFITISKARNKTLKITALNACIKLAGIKGITHLTEHLYPIDEWTQVNIIHAFKKHDIGDTVGVELLLESQNTTVISLGLKLIKELKLTQKIPYVSQLAASASNVQIQYEAQNVVQALTV